MSRPLALLLTLVMITPLAAIAGDKAPAARIDEQVLEGEGPRSIIVSTLGPVDASLERRMMEHGQLLATYSVIDAVHMRATPAGVQQLAALDRVERIDADEELAWHLGTSRPAVGVTEEIWSETRRGANVTIAVVDTGIDGTHPALRDRVETSVTFTGEGRSQQTAASTDEDGHGTHVGGIVASTGDGSKLLNDGNQRYAGVAPAAGLVSLDISSSFSTSTAIDAFEWVHENHETYNIKVVQNSWGRKEIGQPYDPGDPAVRASNTLVGEDDIVVVFSAANKGPEPQTLSLEAMNPNVVSVAAVDDKGDVASFSSRGPVMLQNGSRADWVKPDVSAPGVRITSTATSANTDLYHGMSGTSQAAPHVSGVAALLQTRFDNLSAPQVHEILRTSALDLGQEGPDPATGYGFVNTPGALRQADAAENGTLFTTSEHYETTGTITGPTPIDGVLPGGEGAETGMANGTIPVKDSATRLRLLAEWTQSQTGVPLPDIDVVLEDPSGTEIQVPGEDTSAERTIEDPASGEWGWKLEASGQGAADFLVNGTVTLEREVLGASAGGEGGFGEQGPGERAQEMFEQAVDTYGLAVVAGAIGVVLVALVLVAKATFS